MREIKFRGYSKIELATPTQWICDGYGVSKIEYVDDTSSVHLSTPYGDYWVEEDSVGQYTGLKDMNGVEIYEGDIIKIKFMTMFEERHFIGIVKFYEGSFFVDNEKLQAAKFLFRESDLLEVIGNIYENPELLD